MVYIDATVTCTIADRLRVEHALIQMRVAGCSQQPTLLRSGANKDSNSHPSFLDTTVAASLNGVGTWFRIEPSAGSLAISR